MALYDKMSVEIAGVLVGENMTVDTELNDSTQVVTTIPKGFGGISPGAMVRTTKIKNAVPIDFGDGINFQQLYVTHTPFPMRLTLGGTGASCTMPECYVIGPLSLSSDVTKATEEDITIVGAGLPLQ